MGTPLEQNLGPADLALLRKLGQLAYANRIELYLVGGSVRDSLLGLPVVDLDLTAEAPAEELAQQFVREAGARIRASSQFGTLKLEVQGRTVDLATARNERYVRPGALPEVRPSTIADDLARRDFSVNAMAMALWPAAWGRLLDPTGGQRDLDSKTIRVLHEESFRDDATRILRAVRYTMRLGFRIERRTLRWLRRDMAKLNTISPPRLRRELERMLEEPNATTAMLKAHRLGVLGAVHPALGKPEVAEAIRIAGRPGHGPLTLLGILTYHATSQETDTIAERLALTTRQRAVVEHVQGWKEDPFLQLAVAAWLPHLVVELVEHQPLPAVATVAALAASPLVRSRLRRYLRAWRHVTPALDGDDLLRLGVEPGPAVGQLLRELRNQRLDGHVRSRRAEVGYVRGATKQGTL